MPLITLGENDELKLKIPSRGDIDWAEDFKLYFANPIVKHDHSGLNGMGKQLGASSLSNNSIEERHVNFGLGALNEVSIPSDSSTIASNSYLRWSGNAWAPGSLDPSRLKKASKASREFKMKYSAEAVVPLYYNLYKKILTY